MGSVPLLSFSIFSKANCNFQLFNATAVREATKGTHMNEYIMVFTTMTILYLPLGFVAVSQSPHSVLCWNYNSEQRQTLYGIDMFDFQMPGQTTSFAITTVVVSILAYLAAMILLFGVRRRRRIGSYRELLKAIFRPALPKRIYKRDGVEEEVPRFKPGDDLSKFLGIDESTGKKPKFSLNEILSGSWKLRKRTKGGVDSEAVAT